ncbi:MAG: hypothetical protein JO053_08470 [Acidobacteria bacterium]|nr:hypothetical protein [Acidobacteriota bacterium]
MMNTGPWLQAASQKLIANGYKPMEPKLYQPVGIKFAVQRTGFELSKFGMVDRTFTFAEIEKLDIAGLQNYSAFSFNFANSNKSNPLPNGFFMCTFCFPVVITENLDPQVASYVAQNTPPKHWAAQEMPVVYDIANNNLVYFQSTPLWGAAYFSGMRSEIERCLR